ncbi:MAG: TetR/AcrR family transcriptional regulator [Desulfobacterales bacterium]
MPKIVDKKAKAQAISSVALTVFRKRGYPGTRMSDIAEAAGIGKGTLYEYFKDKVDILRFEFDRYFEQFSASLLAAIPENTGPTEKLLSLIDFTLQYTIEWEDHCAVYMDYFSSARTDQDGDFSIACMYGQMKEILMNLIHEGQEAGEIDPSFDAAAVSELFVSIYDGIIIHRLFTGKTVDRELFKNTALKLIQNGMIRR